MIASSRWAATSGIPDFLEALGSSRTFSLALTTNIWKLLQSARAATTSPHGAASSDCVTRRSSHASTRKTWPVKTC